MTRLGLAGTARQPRFALADAGILAGIVLLGVALPVALALSAHAFAIPRFDDWAYRRVLTDFVHSGHLSLVGWGAMTLVGQIFWAAPFVVVLGAHPWVPDLTVAVASTIGLGSGYWLARSVLGRSRGAACTLALLVLPGVLVQTSTFMTDLPALSADSPAWHSAPPHCGAPGQVAGASWSPPWSWGAWDFRSVSSTWPLPPPSLSLSVPRTVVTGWLT